MEYLLNAEDNEVEKCLKEINAEDMEGALLTNQGH